MTRLHGRCAVGERLVAKVPHGGSLGVRCNLSKGKFIVTKHRLIETLADETKMTKREVEAFLTTFVGIVERTVAQGEKVSITGFGTFDLGKRAARRGVNPQTGAEIHIPAMPMPRFRAGKRLKETLR